MKNILIANDDGINAPGIRALVDAFKGEANIYVSAPDSQRSGASHSIYLNKPIVVEEVEYEGADRAIKCSGTPADGVKMGIIYFKETYDVDMDLVVSGINAGPNIGCDCNYSGTVGAAKEAVMSGLPGIAVSVDSEKAQHYAYVAKLAVKVFHILMEEEDPVKLININAPDLPEEEVKGVKFCHLGERKWNDWANMSTNEEGQKVFRYVGTPYFYGKGDLTNDVIALQEGYATISPLTYDLTNYRELENIKTWKL